ncbi:PKD-like family lipoprotein [Sphingobacterium spiritivorum]|uniref:PKD-like family lipoprotein n=1 Tax=Sphingobacterium spiritivorum TaxID=258 RepID=UPI003DA59EBA
MKKYIIVFLTMCLLCTACSKDKGNYDLVSINEIDISDPTTGTIPVFQYDNLKLAPKLEQTIAVEESRFVYSWSAFEASNPRISYALADTKSLDIKVDLMPGKYKLVYKVNDPLTKMSFFKEYQIEVATRLGEGWLILEDMPDGKQDLSIVNTGDEVLHNLYRNANNGKSLPDNTHSVRVLNMLAGNVQRIFVLADHDAIEVDYVGIRKVDNYKNWFYAAPAAVNIQNYVYGRLGGAAFMVNDNELYSLNLNSGDIVSKFGAPIKGDWKISPFVFPHFFGDYALLYDTKNQRFLSHSDFIISELSNSPGSAFDPNNVGKKLVFGGPGPGDSYNCLMKDNSDDNFFVYTVNASYFAQVIASEMYAVESAPELQNARLFASSGIYMHIYYAADNKIYLLDIPAKQARLVYAFPADAEITAVKMKQSPSIAIDYPDNNREFVVATYQGGEGRFYKFEIGNTGDFVGNSYTKEYKGFKRIKQLEYKNRRNN